MRGKKKVNTEYYSLDEILSRNAVYNVIFGERSNGKTYATLKEGIKDYWQNGRQIAYVRRWAEDFKGKRGQTMFDALVSNNEIFQITDGEWTSVYYWGSRWFLCKYDGDNGRITSEEPFAYGFSLASMEHDKSTSYPKVGTIIFDEFLSRTAYLPDEFVLFMNTISTIVRRRRDVKIFMLGNTVNKYCPYFKEMGLTHVPDMKQGTIDLYKYGESGLTVAVEYCRPATSSGKESDIYFAFNNPKLQMITGGAWEIDIYPHCPVKYAPKDIQFIYFILFDDQLLQCEVVATEKELFTFIHRKTTDLQNENDDLIYSTSFDPRPNWRRKITKPTSDLEKKILHFYVTDKIFYQDNEVGEVIRNYLIWCGKAV